MKRSRAFVLSELLITMMLQAGFILTLFTAFYLMMDFYAKTQAVLSARDHGERVIQFFDDKIRAAGLGLWACTNSKGKCDSETIRGKLDKIPIMQVSSEFDGKKHGYHLPVSLSWYERDVSFLYKTLFTKTQPKKFEGDTLVLLYGQRHSNKKPSGNLTLLTKEAVTIDGTGYVRMLDTRDIEYLSYLTADKKAEVAFDLAKTITGNEYNIYSYAVAESVGVPMHLSQYLAEYALPVKTSVKVDIPAATELQCLDCVAMFVCTHPEENDRQFTYRELSTSGNSWGQNSYQEKNILDIYMELDTSTNIFTLYVLAQGGYDAGVTNPRPSKELWPYHANPIPEGKTHDDEISDEEAENAWKGSKYCHYTVYVSRASWKLNNIPDDFKWN